MKVYLDDVRECPRGWILARWPEEVIALLQTGKVKSLSLDHDLGDDDHGTGYTVLLWLEEQVALYRFIPPREIILHTDNSSAKAKMQQALESIRRFEKENDHVEVSS